MLDCGIGLLQDLVEVVVGEIPAEKGNILTITMMIMMIMTVDV